jgi:hypothetical protein
MIASLVTLVIYIIVIGLVFWLLQFLIDYVGLPEPFHRIAKVVLVVIAVLIVLVLLLQLLGIAPGIKLSSVHGGLIHAALQS